MTAVVIGTHWGQVHINALRQADVEVVGLCSLDLSQCRQIAQQTGIRFACDQAEELRSLDPDLVTIATPAASHGALLRQFRDLPVICEKPLLGYRGDPSLLAEIGSPVWVNYAFAFLDSAAVWQSGLDQAGTVASIVLDCEVNLPLTFNGPQWFLEVASHPLSLLVHQFGAPQVVSGTLRGDNMRLNLLFPGDIPGQVRCLLTGPQGIRQHLSVQTAAGELVLQGSFRWGSPWRYQPVTLAGTALNEGEYSPDDCWLRANQRSLATMVRQLRGERTIEDALAAGLFDPTKAAVIDRCVNQVF